MTNYILKSYDEDNPRIVEDTKQMVIKYILSKHQNPQTNLKEITDALLYEVTQYRLRVKVVYDGANLVGIIASSKFSFYHHQIIEFIFVEEGYEYEEIYSDLCDCFSNAINNSYLAMISPEPIEKKYLNAGFKKVEVKNKEKLLVYLKSKDDLIVHNIEMYYKHHVQYLNRFMVLYFSWIIMISLFILLMFFGLVYNLSTDASVFSMPGTYIITLGMLLVMGIIRYFYKRYNRIGMSEFGFQYTIEDISQFQYKFRDYFKENLIAVAKGLIDSGL